MFSGSGEGKIRFMPIFRLFGRTGERFSQFFAGSERVASTDNLPPLLESDLTRQDEALDLSGPLHHQDRIPLFANAVLGRLNEEAR